MKRIISIIILVLLLVAAVYFLSSRKEKITLDENRITVISSIYPSSFFAREIGGNKISVTTLTPAGIEPHEYDPKPGDLANIYKSKLLIINGANMEPWADRIKNDLVSKGVAVVTASDGIELLMKDGQPDPHVWLDPVSAQRMVLNIRDGLIRVDPANSVYYSDNAANLIVKLINLDNSYRTSLFSCSQNTVVASHSVFGYLEKRYKFHQDTLAGLSPDEEPSSQRISELVASIKQKEIKHILTETLLSPKLSETLAKETGAIVQVFNPLESLSQEELDKNEDYFTLQDFNLNVLRSALQCTTI